MSPPSQNSYAITPIELQIILRHYYHATRSGGTTTETTSPSKKQNSTNGHGIGKPLRNTVFPIYGANGEMGYRLVAELSITDTHLGINSLTWPLLNMESGNLSLSDMTLNTPVVTMGKSKSQVKVDIISGNIRKSYNIGRDST